MAYRVQIVGLQRSGTTWLQNMMSRNFNILQHRVVEWGYAHKHKFPDEVLCGVQGGGQLRFVELLDSDVDLVIVIRKRLSSWLQSIHAIQRNMLRVFPWIFDRGKNVIDEAATELYHNFYDEWSKTPLSNVYHLEYEQLLGCTEEVLSELQVKYNLTRITKGWVTDVGPERPFHDEKREYYLRGTPWEIFDTSKS
jgi:hypothetical protein